MKWIKRSGEGYFPAFECSKCGATIIIKDECFELPQHCENCGESVGEAE